MVGIQFQIADTPAEQVDYTPQQNADRTQHPASGDLWGSIVILAIIAVTVFALQ